MDKPTNITIRKKYESYLTKNFYNYIKNKYNKVAVNYLYDVINKNMDMKSFYNMKKLKDVEYKFEEYSGYISDAFEDAINTSEEEVEEQIEDAKEDDYEIPDREIEQLKLYYFELHLLDNLAGISKDLENFAKDAFNQAKRRANHTQPIIDIVYGEIDNLAGDIEKIIGERIRAERDVLNYIFDEIFKGYI